MNDVHSSSWSLEQAAKRVLYRSLFRLWKQSKRRCSRLLNSPQLLELGLVFEVWRNAFVTPHATSTRPIAKEHNDEMTAMKMNLFLWHFENIQIDFLHFRSKTTKARILAPYTKCAKLFIKLIGPTASCAQGHDIVHVRRYQTITYRVLVPASENSLSEHRNSTGVSCTAMSSRLWLYLSDFLFGTYKLSNQWTVSSPLVQRLPQYTVILTYRTA